MPTLAYHFDEAILAPREDEIVRVVYTRPLNEGALFDYCRSHGIVSYLPLKKELRLLHRDYKDRHYQYQSVVLRPMFPSYVFVKMQPDQRSQIFRSNAIVRVLGTQDFDQDNLLREIRLVRKIETISMTQELEFNAQVKEGDKFLIESGPWQGVYGWLKKKEKRSLWTVEIECVNTLVQATIDPSQYKMTPVEQ
ncbi:MAG: hypothetical protein IJJ26_01605 [Victivallales bacterium]|nr:hypothetical protein [Victivallales bacterium]